MNNLRELRVIYLPRHMPSVVAYSHTLDTPPDTPTWCLHVALTMHWIPISHCIRHHHTTSVVELCLKGRDNHCWDCRRWPHKLTGSHCRRACIENRWLMDVGCVLSEIGSICQSTCWVDGVWSHCIRGCSWAAPSGVECVVGVVRILDNRRKLVGKLGQVD